MRISQIEMLGSRTPPNPRWVQAQSADMERMADPTEPIESDRLTSVGAAFAATIPTNLTGGTS